VRITTIYEGTSEILEMTIARDRWQHHLKTAGAYYRDAATPLAELPAESGGPIAALGLQCLAAVLDACRTGRLTRSQHVLLRLGELIAYAECAGALARRAAAAADRALPAKADRRFNPNGLAAVSRVFARDAAMKVAEEGLRWVAAAGTAATVSLPLDRVHAAQAGLLADMDRVADALYGRSTVEGGSS
jgi:alkylation response protein AidB-like acyl-CoA dehydrogenase